MDPVGFDTFMGCIKRLLLHWVDDANKVVAGMSEPWRAAWKDVPADQKDYAVAMRQLAGVMHGKGLRHD